MTFDDDDTPIMSNDDTDIDQTREVQRTDHGVSITTELKRGTGTRDQDKHVVKAKGANFEEAQHYHSQALDYLTVDDDAVVDRVRDVQPADGGDD